MACITCGKDCKWNVTHSCRVCELVDKDFSDKIVCHCGLCGAYICKDHWDDARARIEAAIKEAGNKLAAVTKKIKKFVTENETS